MEIIEGESVPRELGNVVALLEDLIHDPLRVGDRGAALPLHLLQETPELLRRHGGAAIGVLLEGLLHVLRRLRLLHLELPGEAQAQSVAPHSKNQTIRPSGLPARSAPSCSWETNTTVGEEIDGETQRVEAEERTGTVKN